MKKVVIVGAGHAAGQVAASLSQKKFDGHTTLLGEEEWYPYQRPPLSKKFLSGDMPADRLYVKPQGFYDAPNIDFHPRTSVTSIDRDNQTVHTATGTQFEYDHLVLTTGSRARKLKIPGSDLKGVHYLRTVSDVNSIRSELQSQSRITIIGAGYIGLEVAAVVAGLGHQVTVVEMTDRVMSRVVAPEVSAFYQNVHENNGVSFRLSEGTSHFTGSERIEGVVLSSGKTIPTDLVIVGIGIQPNIELAKDAGLKIADGIVVDDRCQTSDSRIYAAGDCTWHPNALMGTSIRLESVHNAIEQAKTAASNICGVDTCYAQVPWFWSDQYDLKLQIVGLSQGHDEIVIRGKPDEQAFSCLYLKEQCLIAIDAINRPKDFIQSKTLIADRAKIPAAALEDTNTDLKDL